MAGLPLNTFKSVPFIVTNTLSQIYAAPLGITSIVLMAQVANTINLPLTVSFVHYSYSQKIYTYIVYNAIVAPNDALILLGGKLVLQSQDVIFIEGSGYTYNPTATPQPLQFIASILETANQ